MSQFCIFFDVNAVIIVMYVSYFNINPLQSMVIFDIFSLIAAMAPEDFNWTNYLKETRAVAAPKNLFVSTPLSVGETCLKASLC